MLKNHSNYIKPVIPRVAFIRYIHRKFYKIIKQIEMQIKSINATKTVFAREILLHAPPFGACNKPPFELKQRKSPQ